MKRILLLITILCASISVTHSQISYRAKAGLNFSNLKGDFDYKGKTGFHLGAFAELEILNKFALQPELLFSTQGGKFEYEPNSEGYQDLTLKSSTSYLNLHLLAKYNIVNKVYFEAGPQLGFLMSAKDAWNGTLDNGDDYSEEQDAKKDYKKIDFGLSFGVSYKIDKSISLSGRYNFGVSNISNIVAENQSINLKNNVFQLSVSYVIK